MLTVNDLQGVQKFNYLLECLEVEATALVKGFSLTNAAYVEVVALLKSEYDSNKAIIQNYVANLVKLQNIRIKNDKKNLYGNITWGFRAT